MSGFPPFTDTSTYPVANYFTASSTSLIINQSYSASIVGTGSTDFLYNVVPGEALPNILQVSKYLTYNLDSNKKYYISIQGYIDVSHSVNNSTVGVLFSITRAGVVTYSQYTVNVNMPNSGDIGHIILQVDDMFNDISDYWVQNGDIVEVSIASNLSGVVSIEPSDVLFELKVVVE